MKAPSSRAGIAEWLDAAAAHYAAGRLDEAARLYRRAERADPADIRATYSLAVIDLRRGRADAARPRLEKVVAREPGLFAARQNLGAVMEALGRWDAAADAFERALALRPDVAETRFALARALAVLGRLDEAAACYRALMADPASRDRALTRLAILDPGAVDGADLTELKARAADPDVDSDTRTGLQFALGEALERHGADEEAFAAFEAGNRLKHRALAASPDGRLHPEAVARAHDATVRFIEETFTEAFIETSRTRGRPSAEPIFIVGMPRSGSSLIEQILASHPHVQGMGESPVLSDLTDRAFAANTRARPDWRAMADAYLAAMRARGWAGAARLVDKTLENHLRVGVIHLMFPRAVILHSVRDPVDTCLACYRQLFTSGNETLYDLRQIGEAYVRYRRVMAHWARVLPGRVTLVEHEALVADPDERIRWLVTDACALDWDDRCLRFHQAGGAVRTASVAQVRRPISDAAIGRWRRHRKRLGPLLEALGSYAPDLAD